MGGTINSVARDFNTGGENQVVFELVFGLRFQVSHYVEQRIFVMRVPVSGGKVSSLGRFV